MKKKKKRKKAKTNYGNLSAHNNSKCYYVFYKYYRITEIKK